MKPKSDFLGACQFVESIQSSACMGTSSLASNFKTALVTGASSGLGLAFARMLLKEGLTVYGTTRNPGSEGLDRDIRWLQFEGSAIEAVEHFTREQNTLLTSIDILVNNAGSGYYSKESSALKELALEQQMLLFWTPIQLTQMVLGSMRERGSGIIVNVSSLAALFPLPYMAGYSAAKAGLSAYTQGLMLVEKDSGITLIDFQAGDFKTAFNANIRRAQLEDANMERAWKRLEENLLASPAPELAAGDLRRALAKGRSRIIRSGGMFQSRIAPLGFRLLPTRLLHWAIRRYYQIG